MRTTFVRLLLDQAAQRPQAAGLQRGQHLIVVGDHRPRLYACMLAAQALGAVPVPLYQDAVAAEFVYPLNFAEVAFAVVENQDQVDRMLEVRGQCPQLAHICLPRHGWQRPQEFQGREELQAPQALAGIRSEAYE